MSAREGWVEHLRSGGTTTWREWRAAAPATTHGGAGGAAGATQLEVVRRLALARPGLPAFPALADRVLGTAAAGRGPVDVPLPTDDPPAAGAPVFGAPPTEPDRLPAAELLRVASAVLAGLLPATPAVASGPTPRKRSWRRGVVVHGRPLAAAPLRAAVRAAGLPDGGRRARHLVLGGPLEELMFEAWVTRVRRGGGVRWARFWDLRVAGDVLPGAVDVSARAAALAAAGRRVDVVLGADAAATTSAALALLGLSASADPWTEPPADGVTTEARRRLNLCAPTAVLLEDPFRADRAGTLAAPHRHRAWADRAAARIAGELAGAPGGYAVHGDPAVVVRRTGGAAAPDLEAALAATLTAIADAWVRRRHDEEEEG